jgi:hypothetical protein
MTTAARLGGDVPRGPWGHYRSKVDGALILEEPRSGEPLALIYAGLALARYLEAVAPAVLFADHQGGA